MTEAHETQDLIPRWTYTATPEGLSIAYQGTSALEGTVLDSPRTPDLINHPPHYRSPGGLEVVDVMEAFASRNPHRAQAIKYLLRAGQKGPAVTDLAKCRWWLEREIAFLEKETHATQEQV